MSLLIYWINSAFLFNGKRIQNRCKGCNEGFVFILPSTEEDKMQMYSGLLDIRNFIWILRLYKQGEMKYFSYILGILLIEVTFFILLYRIYFIGLLDTRNGFYVFMFLLVWLVYIVARLKALLGLNYFRYLFSDYQKIVELRPLMKYLTIYSIENKTNRLKLYKVSEILQDISDIKDTIIKNVDYFIGFASTVLFVAIVTFVFSK